jgi:hypothetical protein
MSARTDLRVASERIDRLIAKKKRYTPTGSIHDVWLNAPDILAILAILRDTKDADT